MHRPLGWYLAVLAAVGAQRLNELRISRRNLGAGRAEPPAGDPFGAIVALHLGLFILPLAEIALLRRRPPPLAPLWAALLVGASGLRWWSIRSLGQAWNVRAAVPANLEPSERGPYRYIRHPNYLALVVEFAALPLLGGAWISACALTSLHAAVLARRIAAEERLLDAQPAYRARFAGKARFIPGLL